MENAKNAEFSCEKCLFICSKNSEWLRHISTQKHIRRHNGNDLEMEKNAEFICQCGKKYLTNAGLWKHQKVCVNEKQTLKEEEIDALKEIMKYLMKENSEMKNMMMEQQAMMMEQQTKAIEQQNMVLEVVKNGTHNNSHNTTTHTNSHNKAFNLNFFLNETCKEAMNIGEFVDSLKMELCDLERVGEKGYIEGITSIIVKNLKALDITKRPVHCTDKKRETIYIKDDNKWEKDEDKSHMHKLIKKVVSKNMKLFSKFKEKHPDCMTYHSKFGDQYHKIVYESMGGKGDNDFEKNEKIIKNVLKEVVVDKNI